MGFLASGNNDIDLINLQNQMRVNQANNLNDIGCRAKNDKIQPNLLINVKRKQIVI